MNRKILHGNSWSFQEIIQQKFLESGKKMLLEHLQCSVFSKGKSYCYSSNSVIMKRIFTLNVLLSFHFLRNKLTTNIYFNRIVVLSMVSGNALKSFFSRHLSFYQKALRLFLYDQCSLNHLLFIIPSPSECFSSQDFYIVLLGISAQYDHFLKLVLHFVFSHHSSYYLLTKIK